MAEMFTGRWTLASMVSKGAASDGTTAQEPTYPMGRGCGGSIHYDPKNNWMHAILETDPARVPAGFKTPTLIKFIVAFLFNLVRVRVRFTSLNRKMHTVGTKLFQLGAGVAYNQHLCREFDHILLRHFPRRHQKENCLPRGQVHDLRAIRRRDAPARL